VQLDFAAAKKNWWRQLLSKFTGGEKAPAEPESHGPGPIEEDGEIVA
jgi:hypothetical protein